MENKVRVEKLYDMGCYLQVNASSIIGDNGIESKRNVKWLLKREYVHFAASDCHDDKLKAGDVRAMYSEAAGLWWKNRYRAIIEAIANVVLNYLLVKRWGVYGVYFGNFNLSICN